MAVTAAAKARRAEGGLFGTRADAAHRVEIVDPHAAGIDALADRDGGILVADDRRRQAEFGVVGQLHGLVHGIEAHDRHDGAEGLVAHHRHVLRDVGQHGRFAPQPAFVVDDAAPGRDARALGDGVVKLGARDLGLAGEDHRAKSPCLMSCMLMPSACIRATVRLVTWSRMPW